MKTLIKVVLILWADILSLAFKRFKLSRNCVMFSNNGVDIRKVLKDETVLKFY
jgi:hypothetical protein